MVAARPTGMPCTPEGVAEALCAAAWPAEGGRPALRLADLGDPASFGRAARLVLDWTSGRAPPPDTPRALVCALAHVPADDPWEHWEWERAARLVSGWLTDAARPEGHVMAASNGGGNAETEAHVVSFEVSRSDRALIDAIVGRAAKLLGGAGRPRVNRRCLSMDITATHANGCPLRLADLLDADDFNLLHDVMGIHAKIDRSNGRLTGMFRPRFAAPERAASPR